MTDINRIFKVLETFVPDTVGLNEMTILKEIPGLTSLMLIRFIVALENEFNHRFDTRTIVELRTMGDIVRRLEKRE